MIHIDYAPTKECKHPEWTYGEICVQCGECGRFEESTCFYNDFKIMIQGNDGVPPIWRHPKEFGGYYEKEGTWYRSDKLIKKETKLEDIVSQWWYPQRLEYLRWWLETRKV